MDEEEQLPLLPPGEEDDEIMTFVPDDDGIVAELDDGSTIVQIDDEEGPADQQEPEFYDNLVPQMESTELDDLASDLLKSIERDKEARKKRDNEYAEAIRRTGLGGDSPGQADFDGASKAVYPMLTEASIDFSSRAIKELMPGNGPVRMYIPDEDPPPERTAKADRKKNYMNHQFKVQMPEFRTELEQLLPQLALNGSQFMRITPDHSKRKVRPVPLYVPQDRISIPYAASSFYTAERQTYHEPVTRQEFEARIDDGMYSYDGEVTNPPYPEETAAEQASSKVEGKSEADFYNEDGLRIVHECNTWLTISIDKEKHGLAPYLVSIDNSTRKIVRVVRNWEEDDEDQERMQWIVEFPMLPWRGAYTIGLSQAIGMLAVASTGALNALLDSAHANNMPTTFRLKGANFVGQNKQPGVGESVEIDPGAMGDDVRKLIMGVPFNPPSEALFKLLGFCVDAGRGVVRTTFENLGEQNRNLPVGTTLALIEEGLRVFSAIHLRLYHAMTYVINILHRINRMYMDDEEVMDEAGVLLARRGDFEDPVDVVPTADPEVFSDVQRMAQLQLVADRASQMPDVYNRRAVEKRLLERTKIPNPEELLTPEPKPEVMNQVNENAAMVLGRPVVAFPEQDHLAHIQVLLDFMSSEQLGSHPLIAPTFMEAGLNHLREHIVLWYVNAFYERSKQAMEETGIEFDDAMKVRDPETRQELERLLAEESQDVSKMAQENFGSQEVTSIIQKAMQIAQQAAQQRQSGQPLDPNKMAEIQSRKELEQMRSQDKERERQARREEKVVDIQVRREEQERRERAEMAKLSHDEKLEKLRMAEETAMAAADRAASMREMIFSERADSERAAEDRESAERINTQDNMTAVEISAAELELEQDLAEKGERSGSAKTDLSTGKGIDPSPKQRR